MSIVDMMEKAIMLLYIPSRRNLSSQLADELVVDADYVDCHHTICCLMRIY